MEIILGVALVLGVGVGLMAAIVVAVSRMGKDPKPGSALERRKLQGQWKRDDFEAERARRAGTAGE